MISFTEGRRYRFKYWKTGYQKGFTGTFLGFNVLGFYLFEKGSKKRIHAIPPASVVGFVFECIGHKG